MLFQEPKIEFVKLGIGSIIVASPAASWAGCDRFDQSDAMGWVAYCVEMGYGTTGIDRTTVCDNNKEVDPTMTWQGASKTAIVAGEDKIRSVISPSATNAPVRSAPHFNNNLFQ